MKDNFIRLYDRYFDDVYRYILFKTGSRWETDDLVSETFRKAFEKHDSIKSSPKAWLMAIARNTVIDHYRKRKDIPVEEADFDEYMYSCPVEEIFEDKEELACLKKSLKSLDKEELELVNLRYFSGLKYKEIGQLTGKTENAVKVKAMRITKKLAGIMKKCLEG